MKHLFTLLLSIGSLIATAQSFSLTEYDVWEGPASSRPNGMTIFNNSLYFLATDSARGEELWRIDTAGNVIFVNDIIPGSISFPSVGGTNAMAAIGNVLYLAVNDTTHGEELWSYQAGGNATLIQDLLPGYTSSGPHSFTVYNNTLYFSAVDTSGNGRELFEYDPQTNTITQRSTLLQGKQYSNITTTTTYKGRIVFTGAEDVTGSEVHLYDPQIKLSWRLTDIADKDLNAHPTAYTEVYGQLYFTATDAVNGRQMYIYDGVRPPARLAILDSLNIQPEHTNSMASLNNKLCFAATKDGGEVQVFNYDPIDLSVIQLTDIDETFITVPDNFTAANGYLFFSANGSKSGYQVWMYNGDTTIPVTNFTNINSAPANFKLWNDKLFFNASENAGRELYSINIPPPLSIPLFEQQKIDAVLYPNPAQDIAHLQFALEESITLSVALTDMQGRVVYSAAPTLYSIGEHTVHIPLNKLPAGNYIYQLTQEGRLINSGKLSKRQY